MNPPSLRLAPAMRDAKLLSLPVEIEAAISWKVLLDSGSATDRDLLAMEAWLRAPANATAWVELSSSLSPFGAAKGLPVRTGLFAEAALRRTASRRKVVLGLVGIGTVGLGAAPVLQTYLPLDQLTADHVTRTGERRALALADGSELVLGARSAADVDFRGAERRVALRGGEAMLKGRVEGSAPLVARTGPFTLRSDGGTFVMRDRDGHSLMTAVDATATVSCVGAPSRTLQPGQSIVSDGRGIFTRPAELARDTLWVDGLLVVDDHTLDYVVRVLRPYFPGLIQVDPDIATLRVTGVFPLADPSKAIDILAGTLDLSVRRTTAYWITLGPKATST